MRKLITMLVALLFFTMMFAVTPATSNAKEPPSTIRGVVAVFTFNHGQSHYEIFKGYTHAEFSTESLPYGYYKGRAFYRVGWFNVAINWYLGGPNNSVMSETAWWETSRTMSAIWHWNTGALRSGGAGSELGGEIIHGCHQWVDKRKVYAWSPVFTPHPYCRESDYHSYHHNMSMSFNWINTIRGNVVPYVFRFTINSPIAYKLTTANGTHSYRFVNPRNLPNRPVRAYRANIDPGEPPIGI
jgi:hypothetical protein